MTWVTSTTRVTRVPRVSAESTARGSGPRRGRALVVALGLVGALALTACSGSDDASGDGSGGGSAGGSGGGDMSSAAPSASVSASAGAGTGGSSAAANELEGSWLATKDGQAVALMVTGDKAALFATGGTVCSGTTGEDAGSRVIRLKCTDGNEDRAKGTVASVDGTSLKVAWEGAAGEETYTRSEGGSLPPGLPTAGLGS